MSRSMSTAHMFFVLLERLVLRPQVGAEVETVRSQLLVEGFLPPLDLAVDHSLGQRHLDLREQLFEHLVAGLHALVRGA